MRLIKKTKTFIRALRRSSMKKAPKVRPVSERYFASVWYAERYPDVAAAGIDPLQHYLSDGWRERRSPHPAINPVWLVSRYPQMADQEPISWFLSEGQAAGAILTPAFDLATYRDANADLAGVDNLLDHFIEFGWREGRAASPLYSEHAYRAINPTASSKPGYPVADWLEEGAVDLPKVEPAPTWIAGDFFSYGFDRRWYLAKNSDVAEAGLDPLDHYREFGWRELRSPHPMVNPEWLNRTNPEAVGREPLQWYAEEGRENGQRLCPIFDEDAYRLNNPDLADMPVPFEHFMAGGWREHRVYHSAFRAAHYELSNPDVVASATRAAEHFVQSGLAEGRRLTPMFWPDWYADRAGLLGDDQIALLDNYMRLGFSMGLGANPLMDQRWYSARLPEGQRHEACLSHYLRVGHLRGMAPHPLFDAGHYLASFNEIIAPSDVYVHFLLFGDRAEISPHPLFDASYYLASNPEVRHAVVGPLLHYVSEGASQMRWPNPMFDPEHYAWNSRDQDRARREGLTYYVKTPDDQRHPHPLFDGLAYAAGIEGGLGARDPLAHYLLTRSRLDPQLVERQSTGIPTPKRAQLPTRRLAPKKSKKTVSVLMPIYQSSPEHLKRAIDSVRCQSHEAWELIIIDDGSPSPQARRTAGELAALDSRIRLEVLHKNMGISKATNAALELAKGEFVAFLDHDDVLNADALAVMLDHLALTNADAAYSDQSYATEYGTYAGPFFKPDFSPVLMLGVMYFGHLLVVRRKLAKAIGGFDAAFDGLQDFEFMLRLSERTAKITHVPEALYQWRMVPGSVAENSDAKGKLEPLQALAVNAHLSRLGHPITARPGETTPHRLVLEPDFKAPQDRPGVEFLVRQDRPSDAVRHALNLCRIAAPRAKIVMVGKVHGAAPVSGGGSHQPAATLVKEIASRLAEATTPVVVLMDPIVKSLTPNWLDHLLMHLADDGVLAAAPHLVDERHHILAAGYVLGDNGPLPAMSGLNAALDGHAGALACDREVSVSGSAVIAVRTKAAASIGGLGSTYASPLYAFADLVLRGRVKGLRAVAVAGARAVINAQDFETVADELVDRLIFAADHASALAIADPYYNPNFAPDGLFGGVAG